MKCNNGHEATDLEFCPVCGIEITNTPQNEICPVCQSLKTENFCDECGYNFLTKKPNIPPPIKATVVTVPLNEVPPVNSVEISYSWDLLVSINNNISGAPTTEPQLFPLDNMKKDFTIGRTSTNRKIFPTIPLDGDKGISHQHALLQKQGNSFTLIDLGSSNGTQLNGVSIPSNTPRALKEGDTLELGQWTRIKLQKH